MRTMHKHVRCDLAIPMAFPEMYSALESRAIDAQENPYANIYQSRFYEVNKYLTATRHAYNPLPVMVGKKLWDDLTPDERALFHAACDEAKIYQRAVTRAQTPNCWRCCKKKEWSTTNWPKPKLAGCVRNCSQLSKNIPNASG